MTGKDGARLLALAALLCLLALTALSAVAAGPAFMPFSTITSALFQFDGSRDHLLVMTIRLPRVIAALLAGSALAISGAIMQAVTSNPLASPGLLGINAGAAFAAVVMMTLSGTGSGGVHIWSAFAGAAITAAIVYALGSLGEARHSPLGLVLAGAIVAAFLTSLTTAVLIFNQSTLDAMRLWTAGSVAGKTMAQAKAVAPYILAGLAGALLLGRHLTALSLGADASRSLGQNPALWRGAAALTVVLLAGGAVALAGPVGFIGLVVPHIVRMCTGADYRWIIPFCAAGGALLLTGADLAGRLAFGSQTFPAGVTIALLGAPFFLYLARTRVRGEA